ncbi:MAG: ribonuclease P protein component [Magnetococcales bacterium]|nr:ribonuclease P protein component [Magnetococcales bacterium]
MTLSSPPASSAHVLIGGETLAGAPTDDASPDRSSPPAPLAAMGGAPLRLTFPKEARLLRKSEFERVLGQGKRRHGSCFTLAAAPGSGPGSRLGVTISRKVGKAVVRNAIRRVIREAFRLRRHQLAPPEAPMDCVLIARRDAGTATREQWRGDLKQLFDALTQGRVTRPPMPRAVGRGGAKAKPAANGPVSAAPRGEESRG